METSMSNWKTTMKLSYDDGCITTDQIKIKRGISRRFILTSAILPSPCAFNIRAGCIWVWLQDLKHTGVPISNLFYMDDLKLYSKNEQEQVGEMKIVKQFNDDIVWNLD